MMALMSLQRLWILDRQDFLVIVCHHDYVGTRSQALLGAGCSLGIRALGAALGVANPAIYGGRLTHIIKRQGRHGEYEAHR